MAIRTDIDRGIEESGQHAATVYIQRDGAAVDDRAGVGQVENESVKREEIAVGDRAGRGEGESDGSLIARRGRGRVGRESGVARRNA